MLLYVNKTNKFAQYLRSGAASGVTPLGLSATYTAQAAGRRTSTQHDAKKERGRGWVLHDRSGATSNAPFVRKFL